LGMTVDAVALQMKAWLRPVAAYLTAVALNVVG
jgi:hypothetical protein